MVWTSEIFEGSAVAPMQVSEFAERFGKRILRPLTILGRFPPKQGITWRVIPRSPASHVAKS